MSKCEVTPSNCCAIYSLDPKGPHGLVCSPLPYSLSLPGLVQLLLLSLSLVQLFQLLSAWVTDLPKMNALKQLLQLLQLLPWVLILRGLVAAESHRSNADRGVAQELWKALGI